jgi:hypothetical protein
MSELQSPESVVLAKWFTAVAQAALPFESRWTERALRRVDGDLYEAFADQRSLWQQASVTGSVEEVEEHGAAMVRAYGAVSSRLEQAGEPDDAYVIGFDSRTGVRVAIGERKACAVRVREVAGERVTWLTADEVAGLLAGVEAFERLSSLKKIWPAAELVPEGEAA